MKLERELMKLARALMKLERAMESRDDTRQMRPMESADDQ